MHSLKLKKQFEDVLQNYHVSPHGRDVLQAAQIALLVGVSASGRDTIITKLVESGHFRYIASDTTRPPRINNNVHETQGREYWFRSEQQFLDDLIEGKLLEAELIHDQQVSGISIREIEKCVQQSKIGITNVDLNVAHIVQVKPDTQAILVLPPSFDIWMHRLNARGEMHDIEVVRRLKTADKILRAAHDWDFIHIVINNELQVAVDEVASLAMGAEQPAEARNANLAVASQLYTDVLRELSTFN